MVLNTFLHSKLKISNLQAPLGVESKQLGSWLVFMKYNRYHPDGNDFNLRLVMRWKEFSDLKKLLTNALS